MNWGHEVQTYSYTLNDNIQAFNLFLFFRNQRFKASWVLCIIQNCFFTLNYLGAMTILRSSVVCVFMTIPQSSELGSELKLFRLSHLNSFIHTILLNLWLWFSNLQVTRLVFILMVQRISKTSKTSCWRLLVLSWKPPVLGKFLIFLIFFNNKWDRMFF